MRVGIITFHRAHNYGAVLQCYALQEILIGLGYDAEVIDYRQPAIEKLYRPNRSKMIKQNLLHPRSLLSLRHVFVELDKRERMYSEFCTQFLKLSAPCSSNAIPDYDVYIVGSDQVWSIDCVGGMVDPVYFGLFNRKLHSKLLGFSISSNIASIDKLESKLKDFCANFDNITVREAKIAKLVEKKTGIKLPVTLDPTLCASSELWNNVKNDKWKNRKYVALYHVKLRFASIVHKMLLKQTERIAMLHNWDVIDLSSGEYSVTDFISIIKYAQCVVTSSFHATVFSIIFSRPLFCVRLHDGNDERYVDLLNSIGMDRALVDLDFTDENPVQFEYTQVKSALEELRKPSLAYFKCNIDAKVFNYSTGI